MQNDLLQTVRRYCKMLIGVDLENKNPANVDYDCIFGGGNFKNLILSGFRPIERLKKLFNPAFTLAEVLITLGIIGVVAAMTIPSLIANFKMSRFSAALKKDLSLLNQAVKTNYANNDWDFSSVSGDTKTSSGFSFIFDCQSNTKILDPSAHGVNTMGQLLLNTMTGVSYNGELYDLSELTTAYKAKCKTGELYCISLAYDAVSYEILGSAGWLMTYQLLDGSIIGFSQFTTTGDCTKNNLSNIIQNWEKCRGFIDVNGFAGPNKEISCKNKADNKSIFSSKYSSCEVSSKDLGDVIPVVFYDQTVEIASNAGRALFYKGKEPLVSVSGCNLACN